jgi:hypothetical protein
MEQTAFNKVMSAGTLSWEEKNPIGYVFYPSESNEKESSINKSCQDGSTKEKSCTKNSTTTSK